MFREIHISTKGAVVLTAVVIAMFWIVPFIVGFVVGLIDGVT